tara:strand:- start:3184 stop:3315 length:132 start_codon:yes stop_codon:yes gene_type:complete
VQLLFWQHDIDTAIEKAFVKKFKGGLVVGSRQYFSGIDVSDLG